MMPTSLPDIRLATIEDAHSIAVIHVKSWQKIYRGLIPDSILDNLSVDEREILWRELLANKVKILVLEKNNRMIGFASLCASRDPDTDPEICGEISAIYLDPDDWHQGFGKQLCQCALFELKKQGFKEVILWVMQKNIQARKFYESMGFITRGESKTEKHNDEITLDEVRYHQTLKGN